MLQVDWLSVMNLTTFPSALAKSLNNLQNSERSALRSMATLRLPARFSAASRRGLKSRMHGDSWGGGGAPNPPCGPPIAPCGAAAGGLPPGGGPIPGPIGITAVGAVSNVGRFPVGTWATALSLMRHTAMPASTTKRRKVMDYPLRSLSCGRRPITPPINNLRIPAARRQIALAPRNRAGHIARVPNESLRFPHPAYFPRCCARPRGAPRARCRPGQLPGQRATPARRRTRAGVQRPRRRVAGDPGGRRQEAIRAHGRGPDPPAIAARRPALLVRPAESGAARLYGAEGG